MADIGTDATRKVNSVEKFEARTALYDRYADFTANVWCNVQPGQPLLITGETCHKEFAEKIGKKAADITGARVDYHFVDSVGRRERVLSDEPIESLSSPDEDLLKISTALAAEDGAFIRIVGAEDPEILSNLDSSRKQAVLTGASHAIKPASDKIMAGLMNRCVLAAPTLGWARQVRPDLDPKDAFNFLERKIFEVCCMTDSKPFDSFMEQDDRLEEKRRFLQESDSGTLIFGGPGLNLTVGLSTEAIWLGGRKHTVDDRKIPFYANVPIGEVFTTPDWRKVSGMAALTQPLLIGGELVEDARFVIKDGVIVDVKAAIGIEGLMAFFGSDDGHRRFGEIALVSLDSPAAKLGIITKEILIDEKMRCHFAAGNGYPVCIKNGAKLSREEKDAIGLNTALQHVDFMISNEETSVVAVSRSGAKSSIIENGLWAF